MVRPSPLRPGNPPPPRPITVIPSFPPALDPRFDALECAWREGVWRDATLAEAALIITLYESSAHRTGSRARSRSLVLAGRGSPQRMRARRCVPLRAPHRACRRRTPQRRMCVPPAGEPAEGPGYGGFECAAMGYRVGRARRGGKEGVLGRVATSWRATCMVLRCADGVGMANVLPPAVPEPSVRLRAAVGRTVRATNALWMLFCRSMRFAHFCGNVRAASAHGRRRDVARDAHECNLYTAGAHPYLCRGNVSKGLRLWENDPSLGAARCATFRVSREWTALHKRLATHCRPAGVEPPLGNSGYAPRRHPRVLTAVYSIQFSCPPLPSLPSRPDLSYPSLAPHPPPHPHRSPSLYSPPSNRRLRNSLNLAVPSAGWWIV
ncbi:hypothetical protein FB451DRAFT_1404067 [Mycena latifolia]|nr:hypothetical protein FB451DRAFT_1404067 [Mycena latifolia]